MSHRVKVVCLTKELQRGVDVGQLVVEAVGQVAVPVVETTAAYDLTEHLAELAHLLDELR